MANRESDHCIVPSNPGNSGRGKAVTPTRSSADPPTLCSEGQETTSSPSVHDRLGYIHERARSQPDASFDSVFHLLKSKLLWIAYGKLKLNKSPGVDGVSVEDYDAPGMLGDSRRISMPDIQRAACPRSF